MRRLTAEELRALSDKAREVIAARVAYYAPRIGVTYGKITIRRQRTRWGSCSSRGGLSFNCLLMLAPPEALDSVVVHELCHRKEMNHSDRFYAGALGMSGLPDAASLAQRKRQLAHGNALETIKKQASVCAQRARGSLLRLCWAVMPSLDSGRECTRPPFRPTH